MFKKLKEKAGFISLETIVVTGVVIALGLYGLTQYQNVGKLAIDSSIDKITEVLSFAAPSN
jgi:hypothetical protein